LVLPYIIKCITRFVFPQPYGETFFRSYRLSITVRGKYLNTNLKFVLFFHRLWITFGPRPPGSRPKCPWLPKKWCSKSFSFHNAQPFPWARPVGGGPVATERGERHGPRPDRQHHKGREKCVCAISIHIFVGCQVLSGSGLSKQAPQMVSSSPYSSGNL